MRLKTVNTIPPPLARKILLRFLRDDLAEEVQGDLEEKFYSALKNKSRFRAKLNYWYEVFNYMRPFAIRKLKIHLNHHAMFQNNLKIAWRTLAKQKMYSSIKIGGFALGIAACLLIALFIRQELSYDLHYSTGDRIYRVVRLSNNRGELRKGVWFPAPFAKALQDDYPEIELAGHYRSLEYSGPGNAEVRRADRTENTHEEGFLYMDQGLADILELPFIHGDPKTALLELNGMVISKRKADHLFPGEDPIGKVLILNNDESRQFKVTGVIENFPTASHLQADFLLSLAAREFWPGEGTDWRASNYLDYVLVREGASIPQLEKKLGSVLKKYFLPAAVNGGGDKDEIAWVNSLQFKLQPIKDIYLNLDEIDDNVSHGDIRYIWLFGAIATFILVIAAINFINLSTAKSANRAKEVGLRKVVGSLRSSLIRQFLTESIVFSFCSFALGLLLAWTLLPYFNELLGKSLIFPWREWWLMPLLCAGAVTVGVLAGLYPSFYLSSFRPVQVLKGNLSRGSKNTTTRSTLVVFQFTISIVLIVGTMIIGRQMDYILNKKVGYDKDQVLVIQGAQTLGDKITTFKNELLRLPDVKHASISGFLPVDGAKRNGNNFWKEGKKDADEPVNSQRWWVDTDYVETLGLKVLEGRDFLADMPSDSQAIVINSTLAKGLNMKEPIGQRITDGQETWQVIGVIEDFHFESLRNTIEPLSLVLRKSPNTISVKVTTSDMQAMIQAVTKVWKEFSPNQPVRFTFLDDSYARMYDDVQRIGNLFSAFALLAIIVACLGLFALSAFMTEQRSKEISIRLVLGASAKSIIQLLTGNFLKLVLISLVIAAPIAWYMMNTWLQDYAYRIEITWDVFIISGLIAGLIAILTIGYQSVRAALMNPVESLKSE